jgi:Arm DNA-binding domain/Phage integrase, N-terminal SAM-like domain
MKVNFDSKSLDGLSIPLGKQKITLTDSLIRGLQYELRCSGGFFSYRYSIQGRQRGIPIGKYGVLNISDARKRAHELAKMVALGQDPMNIKDEQRQCPTFHEFFMTKYLPFVKVSKRSWDTDDSLYRNHIKEVFGDIKMNQITKAAVRDFLHVKVGKGSAKGSVTECWSCYDITSTSLWNGIPRGLRTILQRVLSHFRRTTRLSDTLHRKNLWL